MNNSLVRRVCKFIVAIIASLLPFGVRAAMAAEPTISMRAAKNHVLVKLTQLNWARGNVWGLKFSPNGALLAIGTNSQIDIWEWRKHTLAKKVDLPEGVNPLIGTDLIQFSPDGSLLAMVISGATDERQIRILNTLDWTTVVDIAERKFFRVAAMAFTPDGKSLIAANSASGDDSLEAFEVSSWAPIWRIALGPSFTPVALRVSPDGKRAAVDGTLSHAHGPSPQTSRMQVVQLLEHRVSSIFDGEAYGAVAWSPDSARVAVIGNSKVEIYDVNTERRLLSAAEPTIAHAFAAYSPDGRYFFDSDANAQSTGRGITVWNSSRAEKLQVAPGDTWRMDITVDGKFLAAGMHRGAIIWQIN